MSSAAKAESDLPRRYGKYELLERIGEGGMAEAYRARLPGAAGFEKILVIKRILPHLARNPKFVQMFVNEAKLAAQIQHQNVVQVFELGEVEGGELYMAMEYVAGVDLRGILRSAAERVLRIPIWFSVHTVSQVLGGLSYAHELGDANSQPLHVVHRDVTPSNIFVSFLGEVKLADFGVAKAVGQFAAGTATRAGQMKGKLAYMPPEQLYGQSLDARTDIFSLGVVLWECLTQRRLFGGKPDFETMLAITEGRREPPSRFNPKIPPELDEVTLRALEPDRERRIGSAREFQACLLEILPKLRPRLLPADVRHVVEVLLAKKPHDPLLGADLPADIPASAVGPPRPQPPPGLDPGVPRSAFDSGLPHGDATVRAPGIGAPPPVISWIPPPERSASSPPPPPAIPEAPAMWSGDLPATRPHPAPPQHAHAAPPGGLAYGSPEMLAAVAPTVALPVPMGLGPEHRAPDIYGAPPPPGSFAYTPRTSGGFPVPYPGPPPQLDPRSSFPATSPIGYAITGQMPAIPASALSPAQMAPQVVHTGVGPSPLGGQMPSQMGMQGGLQPGTPMQPGMQPGLQPGGMMPSPASTGPHPGGMPGQMPPQMGQMPGAIVTMSFPAMPASMTPGLSGLHQMPVGLQPGMGMPQGMSPNVPITGIMPSMAQALSMQALPPVAIPGVPASPPSPPQQLQQQQPSSSAAPSQPAPASYPPGDPNAAAALARRRRMRSGAATEIDFTEQGEAIVTPLGQLPKGAAPISYGGPLPFWVRMRDGHTSGPLSYAEMIRLAEARDTQVREISGDEMSWLDLATFANLTGFDYLSPDSSPVRSVTMLGMLEKRSLVSILIRLARTRATGRLVIMETGTGKVARREIDLLHGAPTFVYSDNPTLQLAPMIVSRELIPHDVIPELIHAVARSQHPFLEIVVQRTGVDVYKQWPSFMRERLNEVFSWRFGKFAFDSSAVLRAQTPFAPSMLPLLAEGVQRGFMRNELLAKLDRLMNARFQPAEGFDGAKREMNLTRAQETAVDRLLDSRSLADIVRKHPADTQVQLVMTYILTEGELVQATQASGDI